MRKGERHMKSNMAKILAAGFLASSLVGCGSGTAASAAASAGTASSAAAVSGKPKIGVIQLMEHTSLNQIYDAFSAQLKTLGYEDGVNCQIDFSNAQGDTNNLTTIVQTMAGNKEDVVVAITTPAAEAAMALTKETPVVFSAVTDPVAAGLVKDLNDTSGNMTGTSDAVNVDQIMDLAMEITPDAKTVGYIYNPGEDNSVSNLDKLKAYCDSKGLTVETAGISTSADLQSAADSLCKKVDMIFVGNDNTVAEAMPVLAKTAIANKIPVYTGADSMVKDGGFATKGIDYTDLGKETANMVDQILKGTSVSDIPVKVFDSDLYIYVNKATAAALGITIPDSITSNAKYVEIGD